LLRPWAVADLAGEIAGYALGEVKRRRPRLPRPNRPAGPARGSDNLTRGRLRPRS